MCGTIFLLDAVAERKAGGIHPANKNHIRFSLSAENKRTDAGRDYRTRLARPHSQARTYADRTYADREIFIFPVQLTTVRTGNLTCWLIHINTLAICVVPYFF